MAETDSTAENVDKSGDKDLVNLVRRRYTFMVDADDENREDAMDDLKFVHEPGYQWEHSMKQERGLRPCYEFNTLRTTIKRIINDIRAQRPAGKVRAVENGDKAAADLREGLIRNIWNISDGDSVVDYAAEYQVAAGYGAWRVITEYVDDSAFEQDLKVEMITNPFTLWCDPSAKDPQKRDAEDWLYTEKIPYKTYEKRFPNEDKVDFDNLEEFDENHDWQDEESIRIAEYWYKEPHEKELWLLQTGEVVDSESDEANGIAPDLIKDTRKVKTNKIMWVVCNGQKILDGPNEWAGSMFPFVVVYGEYVIVDGTPKWCGLTRYAKDAQRSYNVSRTAIIETLAQAPKTQWWATAKQAEGLTAQWAEAHKKNFPFMLYNSDPAAPGTPQRMGGADVPVALVQETMLAREDLKAVTGIFDPSLGAQSNETSGRAIYARQQQGEIATFNFRDNMAKGVKLTYEILMDLIPHIYDTEREMRVLGTDGAEDYVKLNQVVYDKTSGRMVRVNDMAAGKYDVTVTVGPNFATQRQEAAETYGMIAQQFPGLVEVAGDLMFKSMDLPYAEEIAERLQTLLPEPIQKQLAEGNAQLDPAVQAAMAQAEAAMALVQEHGQLVQEAADELAVDKSELEKLGADIKTAQADLRAAKAEFDAHVAEAQAEIIEREVGLTVKGADLKEQGAALKEQAINAIQDQIGELVDSAQVAARTDKLDLLMSQFMVKVDATLGNIDARADDLQAKTDREVTGGRVTRDGGKMTATVQYDDGTEKAISAVREKGDLRIVGNED